ncbi:MAG: hypothetical protein C5B50_26820 [Verrucomicrobia bacterium]|nr:MAG: hypothetical protein C5B50_26820 [Verrucomicrobiota bacterium]
MPELSYRKSQAPATADAPSIANLLGDERMVEILSGIVLVLLTFAAFFPALRGNLVWDDDVWVGNQAVKSLHGLWDIWFSFRLPDYWPLTMTSFWLEWHIWGKWAPGYHLTHLAIHIVAVLLLWRVLRKVRLPAAWLGAALFAIHPVTVESIAWISERKNALSLVFFLASILFYLKSEEGRGSRVEGGRSGFRVQGSGGNVQGSRFLDSYYLLSFISFMLALLSKTSVVMLPVVLLLCHWWRRTSQPPASTIHHPSSIIHHPASQPTLHAPRSTLLPLLPFFALSLVFGLITIWVHFHRAIATDDVKGGDSLERLARAGKAVWFYLWKAVVPLDLMAVYPRWQTDAHAVAAWLPLLGLGACIALLWAFRRSWGRPILFTLAYVVVMLLPALGFVDISFFKYSFVADRWQYASLIGITTLVAGLLWIRMQSPKSKVQSPKPSGKRAVKAPRGGAESTIQHSASSIAFHVSRFSEHPFRVAISIVLILLFFTLTWRQSHMFASAEFLWSTTLERNPACWMAEMNLGAAMKDARRFDEALLHYSNALAIEKNEDIYTRIAHLWVARKNPEEAARQYNEALKIKPSFAPANYGLGLILKDQGKLEEASRHLLEAIRSEPDYIDPYNDLARIYLKQGKTAEATKCLEDILAVNSRLPSVQCNLGGILETQGKLDEARKHFLEALSLDSDQPEPHNGLALVLAEQGKPNEALEHWNKAIALRPDYLDAHNNLAYTLLQMNRIEEALPHCAMAVRLAPNSPEAHFTLANVLLAQKKPAEAAAEYEKVLTLAPGFNEAADSLGRLLAMQGKTKEALEKFRQALKNNPHDMEALNSVAWILATSKTDSLRDGAEAVRLATQATQASPNADPASLDVLAAAYAETGNFSNAVATAQRAVDQAWFAGQTNLVNSIRSRLALYQAGKPFHELQ